MKKFLSLIFILVFGLSACTSAQTNNEQSDEKTSSIRGESTLAFYTDGSHCSSLEEYESYISSNRMPSNFIAYADIADFGDFVAFDYERDSPNLFYWLTEKKGEQKFEVSLSISYKEKDLEPTIILDPTANPDMRICPGTSEGIEKFTHHGLIYEYRNGMLFAIKWNVEDVSFYLQVSRYDPEGHCSHYCLDTYNGDSVAINALLNKDTAGSVKLAFDNMMAQKAEATK